MGSFGNNGNAEDDEIEHTMSTSTVDFGETEVQEFDSRLSPATLYDMGDKFGEGEELQFIQNTMPFNETLPVEDFSETQLLNLGDETQVVDNPDCFDDICTQIIDEFDTQVVLDSEDDGTDRTEVLGDIDALSDDDSGRVRSDAADEEKMWGDTLPKQNGKEEGHDSLTPKLPPTGSVGRGFTSVHAASLRASGLAAHGKGVNNGFVSTLGDKQHAAEDMDLSMQDSAEFEREFNEVGDPGNSNDKMKCSRSESKSRIASSAVRKLFVEDIEEPTAVDLAGLSYVDSQEPGEASQANALDFVERLIQVNVAGLEEEVHHRKSVGDSKPNSCVKGPKRLAKKSSLRNMVGETGIYDFDDGHEDEGGGDFLCRRKEDFFDGVGKGCGFLTQLRKPRHVTFRKNKVDDKTSNIHAKIMHLPHSDSKVGLHNYKVNNKKAPAVRREIRKDIINELDDEIDPNPPAGELEAPATKVGMLDSVGFDTQLAAEAMEALAHGIAPTTHDASDKQGAQVIHNGPVEASLARGPNKGVHSKKDSLRKRAKPSDTLIYARKSKKTRRSSASFVAKQSSVSSQKCCKVSIQFDSGLVKSKRKRVILNAEKHTSTAECGKADEMDTIDGSSISHRRKKQLPEELGTFTPIAHRTRQCSLRHSENVSENLNKENGDKMDLGVVKGRGKEKRNTGATAVEVLGTKQRSTNTFSNTHKNGIMNLSLDQPRDVQNVEKNGLRLDAKLTGAEIGLLPDGLNYPRRRRTCRTSSARVNETGNLAGPPSFEQESKQLSSARQGRSKGAVKSKCLKSETNRNVGSLVDRKSDADSLGSAGGLKTNVSLNVTPKEKHKQSDSACHTPVSCKTPVSLVSPICMGNEYLKQSCKRNLSRSYLVKELYSLGVTSSESTSPLRSSRKRRDMTSVRVLFSHHLDGDTAKQQKKIMTRLGASIASSISDATHFVTDEFVRTRNMLEAIAFGKPVVTHLWLESCGQARCFIDEKNYILRDAKKEKEFGFNMAISLARSCEQPLLKGRRVLITPNTKPGKEILASLVKAVHGQAIERIGRPSMKGDKIPDDLLILSCEDDYELCVPFLKRGATVFSSELLLNGIVTQKLEFARHRLFVDCVKRTRFTTWLKKDNKFLAVARHK